MPINNEVIDLTQSSRNSWLERGGLATQILSVTPRDTGTGTQVICAVVEVENGNEVLPDSRRELLSTAYLRYKCPQLLIQFYEGKVTPAIS